uniref:Mitochondrial phosphate carrier protein n=1 Tax=Trieres chinensis TaxID=1514140 RepID=A0A7S2ETP5_TRICV|mmetsp:Transcript_37329/g.76060  ORF Transcript_37329/g.76060 Transcript_37329/m.76060 type:complete len:336 (+) Transcript_37329:133-1140(+)|eukprot:CAMPEP_0183300678 /NCGR_PEP_ID=MMETSP0160_2-20130417/7011_1 /TAXON_ID=2839 ORGANISM="Odontella Sinensis, Strain Grunow 1884" /NCGR_SAMPLE_ID=MMETSP0160_2 /ASSEMBLY_ACC=CAM_ASM_000250 /LENGTH=335 /DNA_ID=CAMNT_0025463137 /DNA_START=40 /DNA_END=1047 /DNA_ORIENTATION=-
MKRPAALFLSALLCLSSPRHHVNADAGAAAGAAAAASKAGLFGSKALDYRYFVAGGVCAATSHGITTPVDVVKTRMQAEPEVYDKGMTSALLSILKTDGPSALLGGLGPTVIGYGIEGAMKFGVYEVMKPVFAALLSDNIAVAYILASVVAGAVASILLCPMESARIRMVTDKDYAEESMVTVLPKLMKDDGLASLFGGIWAMLSKQVPYTMAKQVSFDVFAKLLYSLLSKPGSEGNTAADLKWIVSVCSAFIASIFACIFSQPGDMILTETYKGSKNEGGFFGVVGTVYGRGGLPAFFTGTGARIVHVGLIITSQLVIYDIVKQALGLPATGSH